MLVAEKWILSHKIPPWHRRHHQGPFHNWCSSLLFPSSCKERSKSSNGVSRGHTGSSRERKPRWGRTGLGLRPGPSRSFRPALNRLRMESLRTSLLYSQLNNYSSTRSSQRGIFEDHLHIDQCCKARTHVSSIFKYFRIEGAELSGQRRMRGRRGMRWTRGVGGGWRGWGGWMSWQG